MLLHMLRMRVNVVVYAVYGVYCCCYAREALKQKFVLAIPILMSALLQGPGSLISRPSR